MSTETEKALLMDIDRLKRERDELQANAIKAAKKWFYESFEDDVLERMENAGIIAQAEGFSMTILAELELEIDDVFASNTGGQP